MWEQLILICENNNEIFESKNQSTVETAYVSDDFKILNFKYLIFDVE